MNSGVNFQNGFFFKVKRFYNRKPVRFIVLLHLLACITFGLFCIIKVEYFMVESDSLERMRERMRYRDASSLCLVIYMLLLTVDFFLRFRKGESR
jgi:hypothetical protein